MVAVKRSAFVFEIPGTFSLSINQLSIERLIEMEVFWQFKQKSQYTGVYFPLNIGFRRSRQAW
jgi:hypothetical protein